MAVVSVCLWIASASDEKANHVAHGKEAFVCSQCGNLFRMTAEEAKSQLQSDRNAYICPSCARSGTLTQDNPPPADDDSGNVGKRHPRVGAGMQPVQP